MLITIDGEFKNCCQGQTKTAKGILFHGQLGNRNQSYGQTGNYLTPLKILLPS